jgi:hypothetical protein
MGPNVVIASACEAIQGPRPQPDDLLDRRVPPGLDRGVLAMTRPSKRDVL